MKDSTETVELKRLGPVIVRGLAMDAELTLPPAAQGLIIVAHGSGSSHLSPRNRFVAKLLRGRGFGTLLLDLETPDEQERSIRDGRSALDVGEMAWRIRSAAEQISDDADCKHLPLGYLGAGTGAAATLLAVAQNPGVVRAVVLRGGRVEMAADIHDRIRVPTLLIVGSHDLPVMQHNRICLAKLSSDHKRLEVIPGADHLFEEPGTLAAVSLHAAGWYTRHLAGIETNPEEVTRALADSAVVRIDE